MKLRHPIRCRMLLAICVLFFASGLSQSCEYLATRPNTALLFSQPYLSRLSGNFHVPIAEGRYPAYPPFNMILWQPNPGAADGELVPTSWAAGARTGFFPSGPLAISQAATQDRVHATTAQIQGQTVGAFLNSDDYPNGTGRSDKLMITPAFMPREGIASDPFRAKDNVLETCLELQIPFAMDKNQPGNFTYVVATFVFKDRGGNAQISYMVTLFHHAFGQNRSPSRERLYVTEYGGYDLPSHTYMIGNSLAAGSRVVTPTPNSAVFQSAPWSGWKTFDFLISEHNFELALNDLAAAAPGFSGSHDPAMYALTEWHLNAELTFATGAARLGWSMRNAHIYLGHSS